MNSFGLPKMPDTRYIRLWSCKAYTKNAIDKELSLSIFAKAAKRTSQKWGAFFAFASANVCFTCRYLVVYLCFYLLSVILTCLGLGLGLDLGLDLGLGLGLLILIYIYLYLFIFILRHLKVDAAYSLS